MSSKTELKDCLAVLKSFTAKRTAIATIKGVAKRGNTLTTTDLDHFCHLNVGTGIEDGLYEGYLIDLLTRNIENTVAPKIADYTLDDFPTEEDTEWGEKRPLCPLDIDHIISASECVSKDTTRPTLTVVALSDGLITGTDGFTLFSAMQSEGLHFVGEQFAYLTKPMVSALKKLRKYGVWTIQIDKNREKTRLTNGTIVIDGKNTFGQFPDINTLLSRGEHFTATVSLDFATVSAIADKGRDLLEINTTTGEVKVSGHSTGVVARINREQDITRNITHEARKVIMPMRGREGEITISVSLLKHLTKSDNLTLLVNLDQMGMIEVL